MNLEQMEYISEVSKTSSISLAAQNLHVSQAAISQSISLLEKEIGIIIFKRSRFGTTPTDEGKFVIKTANEILNKVNEIRDEGKFLNSSYTGELNIASIPSLFITLLPQTLAKFKKDFPKVKISIKEMGGREIIDEISKNRIDLGLTILTDEIKKNSNKYFKAQTLLDGRMNVCVSKDSPLASKDTLTIKELKDYPLVIYGGKNWNKYIEDFEQNVGLFNILFTTNNSEAIKRMVAEGLAISLLTDVMLINDIYVNNGDIVTIPLIDYKPNIISFGAIRFTNKKEKITKKFLEYLQVYAENL